LYNDILARLWQKVKYCQDWKIGLDVALESLRDCRRQRLCGNDD
jgi:hypothetical protein